VSIASIFSFLFISPALTLPLDSNTLGNIAVPLISIGGSIFAGKIIGDYLEGRPVFGRPVLIHTTFANAHPGKSLLLPSLPLSLPALPLPLPALPLPLPGLAIPHLPFLPKLH